MKLITNNRQGFFFGVSLSALSFAMLIGLVFNWSAALVFIIGSSTILIELKEGC